MKKLISLLSCTVVYLALQSVAYTQENFADCKGSSTLAVADKALRIEVASDQRSRNYGLMFRRSLGTNCGMLFVFQDSRYRTFTMRNTLIPLDIAFIDDEGKIKEILTMQPGVDRYPSAVQARYALETNAGWFSSNAIAVGETLQLQLDDKLISIDKLK